MEKLEKKFEEELKKSIEQEKMQELDPTEHSTKIKEKMSSKGENVLGLRQRTNARDWITEETWKEINRRVTLRAKFLQLNFLAYRRNSNFTTLDRVR